MSTITATASEGGSILPRSAVVELGGNTTFAIMPDEGYRISDVLVDGKSVGAVGSYTFTNVRAGHTIRAIFEEEAAENPFADVSGADWYYDAAMYMYRSGLMDGVSDTAFGPNLTTTRAMLATVLWRLEGRPSASGGAPFGDVPEGRWYTEAVDWASENGVVLGLGGEAFGPDINITREQAAAMLYRYAAYKGCDLTADADLGGFDDADAASSYAVTNINWAVARGIISGITETTLAPGGEATRAQLAVIVYRFIGYAAQQAAESAQ